MIGRGLLKAAALEALESHSQQNRSACQAATTQLGGVRKRGPRSAAPLPRLFMWSSFTRGRATRRIYN